MDLKYLKYPISEAVDFKFGNLRDWSHDVGNALIEKMLKLKPKMKLEEGLEKSHKGIERQVKPSQRTR